MPLFLFPFRGLQRGGACWMTERFLPDATTAEALLPGAAKMDAQAARDLRDAFRILISARERVDKLRTQIAGIAGAHELDFDAARDEIGRRLARLRDAGRGG